MSSIPSWIILVVSVGYSKPCGAIACLPDAITPANRKNISVGDGMASMPLKLCSVTWISGSLLHHAARIILQEKLGYNVEFGPSIDQSRRTWMQIADCNSTEPSDRCFQGPPGSVAHLAFEIWESYALGMEEKLALEVPGRVPFVVGELGALGTEAYFVRDEVIQAASKQGLFLQWYESYNASWSSAQTYFARHTDLPVPDTPCQDVSYMQGEYLDDYVDFTGDIDAVVVENGQKKRKCDANGWALSPACRKLVQLGAAGCIPAISYGGWGFHDLAQKAAFYEMPLAIGAFNWAKYIDIPKKNSTFTYWWTPDSALLHSDPAKVIFPAYDADEYSEGIYKSAMAGTRLFKISSAVIASEVQVQEFVRLMEISVQSIMKLVVSAQGFPTSDHEAVACAWLQNNPKVWNKWLPDSTKCIAKQGLVDSAGNFSTEADVNNAIRCEFCEFGRHSDSIQTAKGPNFICRQCEEGRFQSNLGQTSCSLCDIGSFSLLGQRRCEPCAKGEYTSITGATQCSMCTDTLTTLNRGAKSASECQCSEGKYFRPNGSNLPKPECVICSEGLTCPGGLGLPMQQSGYNAFIVDDRTRQYEVYQCAASDWCPQGLPGSCAKDRFGRSCTKIDASGCPWYLVFVLPVVGTIVCYTMYRITEHSILGRVTAVFMLVGNIAIAYTAMQTVNIYLLLLDKLPAQLSWILAIAEVFMLKLQYVLPECNVGTTFSARLSLNILPVPVVIGVFVGLFIMTNILEKVSSGFVKGFKVDNTINVVGMILQVMYVMQCKDAFAYFASRPNPCDKETLVEYSDVILWSDEHVAVGPILIVVYLLIVYVCGTYAFFAWVVLRSRARIMETSFRHRYRFILARWRPECIYWGLLMLARNLIIALIPICVRTEQVFQACSFACILSLHALGEARYMPWRAHSNNIIEIMISMILVLMGILGLVFDMDASDAVVDATCVLMTICFISIWVACLFSLAYAVRWGAPNRQKARSEERADLVDTILVACTEFSHAKKDNPTKVQEYIAATGDYQKACLDMVAKFFLEYTNEDPLRKRYTWGSDILAAASPSTASVEKPEAAKADKLEGAIDLDSATQTI